jgi:hypothetical protein
LSVSRARYIAFIHHLSEEEAVAMFGTSIRKEVTVDETKSSALKVVKAIQYFDMGLGDHDPTEMWRLQTLGGKVLDVSENKYGCLPFAHMELIHFWGMRRNMGRIDMQIPDQVMRNAYERYMRLVLERGPGFDAVDVGKMDPEDQEAFELGELPSASPGQDRRLYPAHSRPRSPGYRLPRLGDAGPQRPRPVGYFGRRPRECDQLAQNVRGD